MYWKKANTVYLSIHTLPIISAWEWISPITLNCWLHCLDLLQIAHWFFKIWKLRCILCAHALPWLNLQPTFLNMTGHWINPMSPFLLDKILQQEDGLLLPAPSSFGSMLVVLCVTVAFTNLLGTNQQKGRNEHRSSCWMKI